MTVQSPFFANTIFPYAQEEILIDIYWDEEQEENDRTKLLKCTVNTDVKELVKRLSKDLKEKEEDIEVFEDTIKSMLTFELQSMNTYHYYGIPTNKMSEEWLKNKFKVNDKSIVKHHVEALLYNKIKIAIEGNILSDKGEV